MFLLWLRCGWIIMHTQLGEVDHTPLRREKTQQ
jgi:hypothetical protein